MTSKPQFESIDLTGQTLQFASSVGTTPTLFPSSPVANHFVSEILINTQKMTGFSQRLQVSVDGGTTYMDIKRNTIIGISVRGQIQQIHVKSLSGTINFDMILNLEEC